MLNRSSVPSPKRWDLRFGWRPWSPEIPRTRNRNRSIARPPLLRTGLGHRAHRGLIPLPPRLVISHSAAPLGPSHPLLIRPATPAKAEPSGTPPGLAQRRRTARVGAIPTAPTPAQQRRRLPTTLRLAAPLMALRTRHHRDWWSRDLPRVLPSRDLTRQLGSRPLTRVLPSGHLTRERGSRPLARPETPLPRADARQMARRRRPVELQRCPISRRGRVKTTQTIRRRGPVT